MEESNPYTESSGNQEVSGDEPLEINIDNQVDDGPTLGGFILKPPDKQKTAEAEANNAPAADATVKTQNDAAVAESTSNYDESAFSQSKQDEKVGEAGEGEEEEAKVKEESKEAEDGAVEEQKKVGGDEGDVQMET